MYPHELKRLIESKNRYLNVDDTLRAISTKENPQLDHIKYSNNKYEMWDRHGNYYEFYSYNDKRVLKKTKK